MQRCGDWWRQAEADLAHARHATADGDCQWSAFAAQQAVEKALMALLLASGGEGWGRSSLHLCRGLWQRVTVPAGVVAAARRRDRHYLPTRYPSSWYQGTPREYCDRRDAEKASKQAEVVFAFLSPCACLIEKRFAKNYQTWLKPLVSITRRWRGCGFLVRLLGERQRPAATWTCLWGPLSPFHARQMALLDAAREAFASLPYSVDLFVASWHELREC